MRFLERATEQHACDRGLKEVALSGSHGLERVARARAMMFPLVTQLVERAQADGSLRADLKPTDMPLLQLMLGALSECTRDVEPEVWRRFLGIVTDGLRARRDAPARSPATRSRPSRRRARCAPGGPPRADAGGREPTAAEATLPGVLTLAKREPSALLLAAQLAALLLYPFMIGNDVGRSLFSVFGIAILGLVVLAVRRRRA